MPVIRGKRKRAQRVTIYAPEGFGKTTFASQFPDPLFADTENGTNELDIARYPISSWKELMSAINDVVTGKEACKTFVVDTADWAEKFCTEYTVQNGGAGINGIEDFGYGKGYTYLAENFSKMLTELDKLIEKGTNVVVTAHAKMRKFEQPDEMGAYDRWELKLSKQCAPLLKEWSDMLLFANYKTMVIEDSKTKTKKAQGGKRVMYTSHHACWDAKNRVGLPDELPFSFDAIKAFIPGADDGSSKATPVTVADQATSEPVSMPDSSVNPKQETEEPKERTFMDDLRDKSPSHKQLADLIERDGCTYADIQLFLEHAKVQSATKMLDELPEKFVRTQLVKKWDGFTKALNSFMKKEELPFD